MDALSKYLEESDPDFQKATYEEEHNGFEVSEVYQGEDGCHVTTKQIDDSVSLSWLEALNAVHEDNNPWKCVSTLIWIKGNISFWPWNIEIKHETEKAILERLRIKQARRLIPVSGGFVRFYDNGSKNRHSFALYVFERFILVWTHDVSTGATAAVCWYDESWFPRAELQSVVEQQVALAKHPMFYGFSAAVVTMRLHEGNLEDNRNKIIGVEARTAYSPFYKSWPATEGSFATLTAEMSGSATYLSCLDKELEIMRDVLNVATDDTWVALSGQSDRPGGGLVDLQRCAFVLKQRLESQKREITYLTRRAEVQITALFNFITQQETRVSISVAQDSRTLALATREDSNAMKTLAAVTVVFLPSTFVAAFFSMPMFHWSSDHAGNSIVSKDFWVFWLTSIPLTILTLGLWFIWLRLQARKNRRKDIDQKASFDNEITRLSKDY